MPLTPEAKKLLAETIRGTAQDPEKGLRARLLRAIHDEADGRYRLAVPIAEAGLDEAHGLSRPPVLTGGWNSRKRREKKGAKEEEQTDLAYEAGSEEEGADE